MTTENRDFKGVWIPKEIWLDERLNATEKIIFVEIDSLDSTERGCWASNDYIAAFCQCSARTVSAAISKLTKLGYIYVQSFDGRQRELKSKYTPAPIPRKNCEAATHEQQNSLANVANQHSKNCEADAQNMRESNTFTNTTTNTMNNTEEKKKVSKQGSFDAILAEYTDDFETLDLLKEWLKVRKAKRAAMTDRAIQMNIDKLDELAQASNMSVKEYLGEVIRKGWAAFYEIKQYNQPVQQKQPVSTGGNIFLQIGKEQGSF